MLHEMNFNLPGIADKAVIAVKMSSYRRYFFLQGAV